MRSRHLLSRPLLRPSGRPSGDLPSGGLRLFDDTTAQHVLVAQVLRDRGTVLSAAEPTRGPGAYLLRYHGPHPAYRDLGDDRVIYTGKAAHLPERISSHRDSLREAVDLEPDDFTVVELCTDSLLHAEATEHLLIGAFDPIWTRPDWRGFGSRPQGGGRTGQRPTP